MITDDFGNQIPASRLQTLHDRLDKMETRMADGDAIMSDIKTDLAANTKATEDLGNNVHEIVEVFAAMKSGIKVLGWLGKLSKPITALVAMCVTLWSAYLAYRNGLGGMR